jgi:hypothetical protein
MVNEEILKAFRLATKCSEREDTPLRERNEFRAIAYQIWKAYGQKAHELKEGL